jgi:hypothetical protein
MDFKELIDPHETQLNAQEEKLFQMWKTIYAPNDSGQDYDFRGAYKAGLTPDPQTGHWPDTFKKPNHPTFSSESIYSTKQNPGGKWSNDVFIPPYLAR